LTNIGEEVTFHNFYIGVRGEYLSLGTMLKLEKSLKIVAFNQGNIEKLTLANMADNEPLTVEFENHERLYVASNHDIIDGLTCYNAGKNADVETRFVFG